jgi:hypothetical protein
LKSKKLAEKARPTARAEKLTAPVINLKEPRQRPPASGTSLAKIKRFQAADCSSVLLSLMLRPDVVNWFFL